MSKGGYFKKFDFDVIKYQSKNQHFFENDCCPCTFNFLHVITNEEFINLMLEYGEKGMYTHEIELFFNKKYPEYIFKFIEMELLSHKKGAGKIIINLFKSIKKGFGMIVIIRRKDGSSHCLIFARDNDNNFAIFDPQVYQSYVNGKQVAKYLNDNKVISIDILSSENMYGDSLVLDDENLSEVFYDTETIPDNYDMDNSLDQFYSF